MYKQGKSLKDYFKVQLLESVSIWSATLIDHVLFIFLKISNSKKMLKW